MKTKLLNLIAALCLFTASAFGQFLPPTILAQIGGGGSGGGRINPSQINAGGAATGNALVWSGTAWAPATLAGGGNALQSLSLAQFAATTSAQLAGVLTNESGTGFVAFTDSPVFTTQITAPKIVFTGSVFASTGSGTPEGSVTAAVGSLYLRTNGGTATTLYVKESGSGNTGWAAVGGGSGGGVTSIIAGSGISVDQATGAVTVTATSSGGSVTTVSVAAANGFTGTVANATTTPAITIVAGAITPTSVSTGALTSTGAVTQTGATTQIPTAMTSHAIVMTTANNTESLAGNVTATFSGSHSGTGGRTFGATYTTDSTARTVTLPANVFFNGAAVASIVIPASSTNFIQFYDDGTNYFILNPPPLTSGAGAKYALIDGTLNITSGKTLTASNTLTFIGTDGSSVNFGTGGTVSYGGGSGGDVVATLVNAQTTALTANTTLTGSDFGHVIHLNPTSGNITITLPTITSNADKSIVFVVDATATKLVTLDANGSQTIDGALTRIIWKGESAHLLVTSAEWVKIGGKTIPMVCKMSKSGAQTITSGGSPQVITIDTTATDNTGLMASTGSNLITCLRGGNYTCFGTVAFNSLVAGGQFQARIQTSGAAGTENDSRAALASGFPAPMWNDDFALATSDTVQLGSFQNSGVSEDTFAGACVLGVYERPSW